MQPTLVDAGVLIVTLLSGFLAYSRGFTREIFAIGGWILAGAAAFYLTPIVEPLMREAPVVGPWLAKSCLVSTILAFTLVVALGLLVLSVFTSLLSNAILDSVIGPVDRAFGFIFGVARGVLLIAIAYMIYDYSNISAETEWPPLANAESRVIFDEIIAQISANLPDEMPDWFAQRIDSLGAPCGADFSRGVDPDAVPPAGTGATPSGDDT